MLPINLKNGLIGFDFYNYFYNSYQMSDPLTMYSNK
jgi:hypothetical protein